MCSWITRWASSFVYNQNKVVQEESNTSANNSHEENVLEPIKFKMNYKKCIYEYMSTMGLVGVSEWDK
jgi:hypothetical protein